MSCDDGKKHETLMAETAENDIFGHPMPNKYKLQQINQPPFKCMTISLQPSLQQVLS
jgi:hypothetical protein